MSQGYSYGEAVTILLNPKKNRICSKHPVRIANNHTFVVNLKSLDHPDDLKSDDCGHWIHKGRKSSKVAVWFCNDQVVCVKSTCSVTPPDENSKLFTLVRSYFSHDPHGDFKRTFYFLYGKWFEL